MKTLMYRCPICGNVIMKLVDSGVVPSCCGHEMQLLIPQTKDETAETQEKHMPDVQLLGDCTLRVEVGSTPHPMSPDHKIDFILLETEHGAQIRYLNTTNKPTATFYCGRDKPVSIYALCNIHGLWQQQHLPVTKPHRCGPSPVFQVH